MFRKKDFDWAPFRDIVRSMAKSPQINPPEDFTGRVLEKVDPFAYSKAQQAKRPQRRTFAAIWAGLPFGLTRPVSRKDCSFFFFVTAYFYLILGVILLGGLKSASPSFHGLTWVSLQPLFLIATSLSLGFVGVRLATSATPATSLPLWGSLLFTVLVILNGWWGFVSSQNTLAVFLAASLTLTGCIMAFLLLLAAERWRQATFLYEW